MFRSNHPSNPSRAAVLRQQPQRNESRMPVPETPAQPSATSGNSLRESLADAQPRGLSKTQRASPNLQPTTESHRETTLLASSSVGKETAPDPSRSRRDLDLATSLRGSYDDCPRPNRFSSGIKILRPDSADQRRLTLRFGPTTCRQCTNLAIDASASSDVRPNDDIPPPLIIPLLREERLSEGKNFVDPSSQSDRSTRL